MYKDGVCSILTNKQKEEVKAGLKTNTDNMIHTVTLQGRAAEPPASFSQAVFTQPNGFE